MSEKGGPLVSRRWLIALTSVAVVIGSVSLIATLNSGSDLVMLGTAIVSAEQGRTLTTTAAPVPTTSGTNTTEAVTTTTLTSTTQASTTTATTPVTTTTRVTTTTAAPITTTTAAPQPSGFPNANNTGVPSGIALKASGSLVISTPGTVIDGYDVSGTITINANNVTIKRSRIRGANWWIVRISPGVTGAVIEDSEIDGRGLSGNEGSHGIYGPGTFRRNNIYGVENGITLEDANSLIEANFIHGLAAPGAPHYDGIQIDGDVSNVMIRGNTIINDYGQTAAIMIDNDFGPINNIRVESNRLIGGGYTVYSDGQFDGGPITGVSFNTNRIGGGHWGYALIRSNTITQSGNVDDNSGALIDLNG